MARSSRSIMSAVRSVAASGSRRWLSAAAADAKNDELVFTLSVPSRSLVNNRTVKRVTVPAAEGELGLEKDGPASLLELRPGIVDVLNEDDSSDKWFIPGGFAFYNPDNTLAVSTPEGVSVDEIDEDAIKTELNQWQAKLASAETGSKEEAEATIVVDMYRELQASMGRL